MAYRKNGARCASLLFVLLIGLSLAHAALHYQQQQQQQQPQQQLPPALQNPMFLGSILQQQQQQPALVQDQQQSQLLDQQPQQQQQQLQQLQHLQAPNGHQSGAAASELAGSHRPVQDREAPIFRYQGVALNSSTVKLVWNLLSGYHADYFDIEWGPIPDATHVFSVSKLNGTARDYTFHQLQPDTLYQFQLYGYNADHIYKPQLVAVRTPPANYQQKSHQDFVNRDIMPLGVKAEAKSNNSIQLSWTEADKPANLRNSNRVNIIRYYVNPTLTAAAAASGTNETNMVPATAVASPQYHYLNVTNARESKLIVQKLKPATEYAFAVKTAYYAPDMKKIFTQSGFSMDTLARTYDIEPSAPRSFSIKSLSPTREESLKGQAGKLELSWLAPESPNGQLKGYVILHTNEQMIPDEQWKRINVSGANINNWYVANIQPGWSYYFKIRAINQRGESSDSETRLYVAPLAPPSDKMINATIPANNVLLLIVICMVVILFILSLLISKLTCRTRRKPRKGSMNAQNTGSSSANNQQKLLANGTLAGGNSQGDMPKLNGFASTNSSSTVVARVGTLARRRDNSTNKPDFWISAMDQKPDTKSVISEKSNSDLNMAMVSIQRDSPQFATTQLAPALPDYRFASGQLGAAGVVGDQQLLQQLQAGQQHQQQQQSHYHPGQQFVSSLACDQMDNATASALMTLSKRQQQQLQKYQIQFATTGVQPPTSMSGSMGPTQQALSPHQQPPPPPPLNIEQQQQQQQQQQQSIYGTHNPHHQLLANTRSLRLHRPTLYDPVSGSFVQSTEAGPPNYNTHHMHPLMTPGSQFNSTASSNTLQFHHPHQTSTLMSRRSTNTLRSFQTSGSGPTYGQLAINTSGASNQFGALPPPPLGSLSGSQQPQQLLQSHQAVINQLNNSTYPSLPLKHVSAVRPQVMSSLEDQIELELAEKEQQQQQQPQHQQQQQQDQQQQMQQQQAK